MKRRLPLAVGVLTMFLPALLAQSPNKVNQPRNPQVNPALRNQLQSAIAIEQQFAPGQRKLFSGALQNWLAFGHSLFDPPQQNPDDGARLRTGSQSSNLRSAAAASIAASGSRKLPAQVSDLSLDLQFTHVGGFTQSTSSSAWCGRNVVVGFNDSTATMHGIVAQDNGQLPPFSSLGVSFSHDGGATFTDLQLLNPGPFPNGLFGNPVLVCASSNRFYYTSAPFFTGTPQSGFFGVALNISEDGGKTWAAPVPAVAKDAGFHILDKEWLVMAPNNHDRLYVSYTDFDAEGFSSSSAKCPKMGRVAIELVSSSDGGRTWGAPSVVREDCVGVNPFTGQALGTQASGSQVAVGPDGHVYVSYLLFPGDGTEQIVVRSSSDRGTTFAPEVTVSSVTPAGIGGILQGFFIDLGFHAMAVDSSKGSSGGTIYTVWSDGRDNSTLDVIASNGTYNFGDILLSKSTDHGATWSAPLPVSPAKPSSAGRDQFQPGVAVDSKGRVAVCYSDRRNDPQNNLIDHYCSVSRDQGMTFQDIRMTAAGWVPTHDTDELMNAFYLGDYDTVSAESSGQEDGFFSSFQVETGAKPNVQGRSFAREH